MRGTLVPLGSLSVWCACEERAYLSTYSPISVVYQAFVSGTMNPSIQACPRSVKLFEIRTCSVLGDRLVVAAGVDLLGRWND